MIMQQEEAMSDRDIDIIFKKLDIIGTRTANTEASVKVITTKLEIIDSRGSEKSTKSIDALNAKVNWVTGAGAVLGLIFSDALSKIGIIK